MLWAWLLCASTADATLLVGMRPNCPKPPGLFLSAVQRLVPSKARHTLAVSGGFGDSCLKMALDSVVCRFETHNGHIHLTTIEKTDTNGIMTNSKNKPDDYLIITLEIMQNNKFLLLAKQNWAVFCYSQLKTCNMKTYVLTGIMLQHFSVWLHGLYQNSGLTLLF